MQLNGKAVYFVAVKLLLRDGNNLLITHDIFGQWDIPGGRLKEDEFKKPFELVIERKINEELGADVRYEVGEPKVFFRVERFEHGLQQNVQIFAIGFEAKYLGGDIVLGDHHDRFEWVDVNTFKPEEKFEDGWLEGLKHYLELIKGRG